MSARAPKCSWVRTRILLSSLIWKLTRLDTETSRKVTLHLLECEPCREAYLRLRSLNNDQFEELLLAEEIDLGKNYAADTQVGPVRIVSEKEYMLGPLLKVTVIRFTTGENVSISLTLLESKIPAKTHLFRAGFNIEVVPETSIDRPEVSLWSEKGKKLSAACTDATGFCALASNIFLGGARFRLTLRSRGMEKELRFLLPAKKAGVAETIQPGILNLTEQRVLELFALGHRDSEIAKELSLSKDAVKGYIYSAFAKAAASSRGELKTHANDLGLLPDSE
jgi:DNA-binding CsgD family transcriptional regulator